jgi:predicted DNA-binding transcriptional regulator AlpA
MADTMIDRSRIAKMLGVTVETLRKRVEPRPDFPKPALRLSQKTVRWDLSDVNRWLQRQKSTQS